MQFFSFSFLRLYERVISEHLDSWYRELSHDEEFLQVHTCSFNRVFPFGYQKMTTLLKLAANTHNKAFGSKIYFFFEIILHSLIEVEIFKICKLVQKSAPENAFL